MGSTVYFIFRILAKVPIYMFAFYLVLNVLSFGLAYHTLNGLGSITKQIAMENNFIP